MTTGAGTGTASSRREKEDTRHSVACFHGITSVHIAPRPTWQHKQQPRPGGIHAQQHTARPPPTLPAASTFRRGDHPQTRQGEHHQHDHSPTPSKSHTEQRPALEADRRSRRE